MKPFESKILSAACILLCLVSLAAGQSTKPVTIPNPDALDAFLDKYVDQGGYPFLYARLEDKEARVIYEHGIVAERTTGKSLKQLVEKMVTGPLKIKGLRYGLPKGAKLLPKYSGKDVQLRIAKAGELDIFGPSFPKYDAAHELYLGGEGMVATADGYADFLRMLLRRGTLNGKRFLNKSTVKDITSPHTHLDSEYGYNGYNLWINSGKLGNGKKGEGGLWIGGGYEGTHFWIDPKREFVGVIMTQMFWLQPKFYGRDDGFREEVYKQLRK